MTFASFSDVVPEVGGARPRRVSKSVSGSSKGLEPVRGADLEQAAFERGVAEGRRQLESEIDRWQAQCEAQIAEAVARARLDSATTDVQALAGVIVERFGQIEARLAETMLGLLDELTADRLVSAEREALIATVTRATAVAPSSTVRISGPEHLVHALASALSLAHVRHEIVSIEDRLRVDIDDTRVELGLGSLENVVRGVLP